MIVGLTGLISESRKRRIRAQKTRKELEMITNKNKSNSDLEEGEIKDDSDEPEDLRCILQGKRRQNHGTLATERKRERERDRETERRERDREREAKRTSVKRKLPASGGK